MQIADTLHADLEISRLRDSLHATQMELQTAYLRHRPSNVTQGSAGRTVMPDGIADGQIVRRVMAAYARSFDTPMGSNASFWLNEIADIRQPEHETLIGGDCHAVQSMLRDPSSNNLFYGFDILAKGHSHPGDGYMRLQGELCYDLLLRLAEAVGSARLGFPEGATPQTAPGVEDLLTRLDDVFGFTVDFPNPYPNEIGLQTSRGLASYRALQALYQAYCVSRLAPRSVVEIGGGLGRTAYYAVRFGIGAYTIVDLPLGSVAQAYFLDRAGVTVQMFGENRPGQVRLAPPSDYLRDQRPYDLTLNVDSFTEMAGETMQDYIDVAARRSSRLLSINHEYNGPTVFNAVQVHPAVQRVTRELYWLRRGFVHELVWFKPRDAVSFAPFGAWTQ